MKNALVLSLLVVGAAPAMAAPLAVKLSTTPLTLSRTDAVHVDITFNDGTTGIVDFSAAEIQAGVEQKPYDVASSDDIAACTADWSFAPIAGDILPNNASSVDNMGFECTINSATGAVKIVPLTTVQSLVISAPATAFASRSATSVHYLMGISQMHGLAWTYDAISNDLAAASDAATAEHITFTGGCLTYHIKASWQVSDGPSINDADRTVMAETYILE